MHSEQRGCASRMATQLADLPEVKVVIQGTIRNRCRRVATITGLPSKGITWTHANDVANIVDSVHERVLGTTVDGTWQPTMQAEKGSFAGDLLVYRRRVTKATGSHSLPITKGEFISHYRGQKQSRYANAAQSLESRPLAPADGYPGVFLKAEKWHEPKAGRVISARSPRYLLELGCYIQPLERVLFRAIDEVFGSRTIMKGLTPAERAEVVEEHWGCFSRPVAVGQDFSKFDQHIGLEALQWEHGFYLGAYNNDSHLQRLLSSQLKNKCYAQGVDGKVKYSVRGGRMSGDMNTALGNCIISSGLVWAYAKEQGIKIRLIVDGDDSVTFLEQDDLARYQSGIKAWMARRGFKLVSEAPVSEISKVEFCQCRYVGSSPSTMVRNPLKAITQDHKWIVDEQLPWAEVLAATGLGGLALYGNMPVLGAYYRMLAKTTTPSQKTLSRLDRRSSWLRDATFNGQYDVPSEQTRYAFWQAWDIAPELQRQWEARFAAMDLSPMVALDINNIAPAHNDEHCFLI